MTKLPRFAVVLSVACFLNGVSVVQAGTDVFFSPSQTATQLASTITSTTIRSGAYEFTYSVDGYWSAYPGGPPTGRFFSVFWPDGIQAQAITAGPTVGAGANITIKRTDGKLFDLQSFTGKLLANTAGAGGAFEIMPKLNGEDALNDPMQYGASGYAGQSFSHTPNLVGYESYTIHLWVDYALTALTLNHTSTADVAVSAAPSTGGSASGDGTYPTGDEVMVSAIANPGYVFVNWTEGAMEVSTLADYSFILESDRTLVANFIPGYTIDATISPWGGGTVTGTGACATGNSITLVATPNAGYTFRDWSLNGTPVSNAQSYTFTPDGDLVLDATFEIIIPRMSVVTSAPGMMVIEWQEYLDGWMLEESPDLSASSWFPSSETVEVNGNHRQVSVQLSGGMRFFRLSHP